MPEISGGFTVRTVSPDGRTIAFSSGSAFWVMNNDGSGVKHVADWAGAASKGKHFIYTGMPGPDNEPHTRAMDDAPTCGWRTTYLF